MKQKKMKRKEIQDIFYTGMNVSNPYLKIFYKNNQQPCTRYGIAIKREFGPAVERNKAKRHIRELYRKHEKEIRPGLDMMIFIKNEFREIVFKEKEKMFLELIKKLFCIIFYQHDKKNQPHYYHI